MDRFNIIYQKLDDYKKEGFGNIGLNDIENITDETEEIIALSQIVLDSETEEYTYFSRG